MPLPAHNTAFLFNLCNTAPMALLGLVLVGTVVARGMARLRRGRRFSQDDEI